MGKIQENKSVYVNCNKCGEKFRVPKHLGNIVKRCKNCKKIPVHLQPDKVCLYCNKKINKNLPNYKKRKYCNRDCMSKHRNLKVKVICKTCNKIYEVSRYVKSKYCSLSCRNKAQSEIYKSKNNPNWKGGLVKLKCQFCGKDYYKIPSLKNKSKFCSIRCNSINTSKNGKPQKDTDIERILKNWLDENSIVYQEQKTISNRTIVDFFIEPNICLYADGDYWHSKPDRVKSDKAINKYLKKNNYKVIRLLGSEINNGKRPLELLK